MTATTTYSVRRAGTVWNKLSLGASRYSFIVGFATDVTQCQVPSQVGSPVSIQQNPEPPKLRFLWTLSGGPGPKLGWVTSTLSSRAKAGNPDHEALSKQYGPVYQVW